MRIVDHPSLFPHHCAVLPYVGASRGKGFFDTGNDLDRQRVYVSFEAACEMARELGWSGPSVRRGLEEEINALKTRVEELGAEVAEADRYRASIDYISDGPMKPYKKAGRPKTKVEA